MRKNTGKDYCFRRGLFNWLIEECVWKDSVPYFTVICKVSIFLSNGKEIAEKITAYLVAENENNKTIWKD